MQALALSWLLLNRKDSNGRQQCFNMCRENDEGCVVQVRCTLRDGGLPNDAEDKGVMLSLKYVEVRFSLLLCV